MERMAEAVRTTARERYGLELTAEQAVAILLRAAVTPAGVIDQLEALAGMRAAEARLALAEGLARFERRRAKIEDLAGSQRRAWQGGGVSGRQQVRRTVRRRRR